MNSAPRGIQVYVALCLFKPVIYKAITTVKTCTVDTETKVSSGLDVRTH